MWMGAMALRGLPTIPRRSAEIKTDANGLRLRLQQGPFAASACSEPSPPTIGADNSCLVQACASAAALAERRPNAWAGQKRRVRLLMAHDNACEPTPIRPLQGDAGIEDHAVPSTPHAAQPCTSAHEFI